MYPVQCLEPPPGAAHALAVGLLKALAPRACGEALWEQHQGFNDRIIDLLAASRSLQLWRMHIEHD